MCHGGGTGRFTGPGPPRFGLACSGVASQGLTRGCFPRMHLASRGEVPWLTTLSPQQVLILRPRPYRERAPPLSYEGVRWGMWTRTTTARHQRPADCHYLIPQGGRGRVAGSWAP